MISLVLAVLNSIFTPVALAATPPPVTPTVDTSGLMDLGVSAEEQMVSEGLPPTPESGSENPEDLLRSGPAVQSPSAKKGTKSASVKGAARDELPASLPMVPRTKTNAPPSATADLPPPPSANSLTPEASTEIPGETLPSEDVVAEAPPAENLEDVVVPADADAVAESDPGATSTKKYDRSIPLYDRENPSWGIDIHGSLQALGNPILSDELDTGNQPTGNTVETDIRNFGIGFEYEPKFLQSIGVVSIGPSLNVYIAEPAGDLTSSAFSIYSLGMSAKYQLKFARSQFLVPFVGFEAQMIRYSFENADVGSGWTTATGPVFGALLLLNWIEPSAAHNLWAETNIKRSYLFAEVKNLSAGETVLSTEGTAIYFGMRLEY